jgi:hypothetical protein
LLEQGLADSLRLRVDAGIGVGFLPYTYVLITFPIIVIAISMFREHDIKLSHDRHLETAILLSISLPFLPTSRVSILIYANQSTDLRSQQGFDTTQAIRLTSFQLHEGFLL